MKRGDVIESQLITEIEHDVSCQEHWSNQLNLQYIYRVSYKNAKRTKPLKWIYPY